MLAPVCTHSEKNCFINLRGALTGQYFSLDPQVSSNFDRIYVSALSTGEGIPSLSLNGLFATKLGLKQDSQVVVEQVHSVDDCTRVFVEPEAVDDYEIVELQKHNIEDRLLQQIRLVFPGLIFPAWLEGSLCVFLRVVRIEPAAAPCALLTNDTDFSVAASWSFPSSTAVDARTSQGPSTGPSIAPDQSVSATIPALAKRGALDTLLSWLGRPGESTSTALEDATVCVAHCLRRELATVQLAQPSVILRVQPFPADLHVLYGTTLDASKTADNDDETLSEVLLKQPTTVCVRDDAFPSPTERRGSHRAVVTFLALLRCVDPPTKPKKGTSSAAVNAVREAVVRVVVVSKAVGVRGSDWPSRVYRKLLQGHVIVSNALRLQLHIGQFSPVQLHVLDSLNLYDFAQVKQLVFHCIGSGQNINIGQRNAEELQTCLACITNSTYPLVLQTGTVLSTDRHVVQLIEVVSSEGAREDNQSDVAIRSMLCAPTLLNTIDMKVVPLRTESAILKPSHSLRELDQQSFLHGLGRLANVDSIVAECVLFAKFRLGLSALTSELNHNRGHLLITGMLGCGKTTLAKAIAAQLQPWPYCCYVQLVDCRTLKGKNADSLHKYLRHIFELAAYYRPSVILLDNLEHLCQAGSNLDQLVPGLAFTFERVAHVLVQLVDWLTLSGQNNVLLIATARHRNQVHASLTQSRNKCCFVKIIELSPMSLTARKEVFEACLENADVPTTTMDAARVARLTEGFSCADFVRLVECSRTDAAAATVDPESIVPMVGSPVVLTTAHVEQTLTHFLPTNLESLHMAKGVADTDLTHDVGGLAAVKRQLTEAVFWPIKYPELLSLCPIRLCRGLLLYGAPGSGKTLLARAVAKESGCRFISIKGPELLSKYIGASEQSVRDTFERARNARPCLLFFDEFESLAPRRGHDSTGVTDRVVNQLLTELDGVESLEGVFVLAATSRPDLLDPALLRPGRIDKLLYCALPNEDERSDILRCLCRRVHLADDVDVTDIAKATPEYSGADLRALLYTAQLATFHDHHHHSSGDTQDAFGGASLAENVFADSPRMLHFPTLKHSCVEVQPDEHVYQEVLNKMDALVENGRLRLTQLTPANSQEDKKRRGLIVQWRHVNEALAETRPALSSVERARYTRIYERFGQARTGHLPDLLPAEQRVTLA